MAGDEEVVTIATSTVGRHDRARNVSVGCL
jgi:hypothetical protein